MTSRQDAGKGALATNRKARHEYHILDSWEVGLSLTGGEVKSCRAGHASLAEAYAAFENGELFIYSMRIQPYAAAASSFNTHEPDRPKKSSCTAANSTASPASCNKKATASFPSNSISPAAKSKWNSASAKANNYSTNAKPSAKKFTTAKPPAPSANNLP